MSAGLVSDFRQTPVNSAVMSCGLKVFRLKCVRTANKVFCGWRKRKNFEGVGITTSVRLPNVEQKVIQKKNVRISI